jgi:hypothetical protein
MVSKSEVIAKLHKFYKNLERGGSFIYREVGLAQIRRSKLELV